MLVNVSLTANSLCLYRPFILSVIAENFIIVISLAWQVGEGADSEDFTEPLWRTQPPVKVHVQIDNRSVPVEIDTGASVSIMSEKLYHELWPRMGISTTETRNPF